MLIIAEFDWVGLKKMRKDLSHSNMFSWPRFEPNTTRATKLTAAAVS